MHLKQVKICPEKFPVNDIYPFNLELLHKTEAIELNRPVTFFVGENGCGKSTVLEAIAHLSGIHIWRDEERRRFRNNPHEKKLYRSMEAEWVVDRVPGSYFSSDIFYDFARFLDEWALSDPQMLEYYGGDSLMTKSHGQSLMAYFKSRYKIKGLYLLDEPETALSPKRQIELLRLIEEESRKGHAQFIIASHSPILLSCGSAEIFSFDDIPVRKTDYRETVHYKIYRDFMNRE